MQLRRLARNNKGQFIVIAVLMISIMVISVATIMYSAVTYYRHERWEEYLSIVDNVEMGSYRLLELSLANYTMSNSSVLTANLDQWQRNLLNTYPQYRIALSYSVPNGGTPVNYNQGLSMRWNQRVSFSAAKASFSVNITSVGLTGYKFTRSVLLNLTLLNVLFYPKKTGQDYAQVGVRFSLTVEGPTPLMGVAKSSFSQFMVNGADKLSVSTLTRKYDTELNNCYVYELRYQQVTAPSSPASISLSMIDYRNIRVAAQASLPVITV